VSEPRSLAGQVALVTGATSGLGRRFAVILAAAGAQVVACGRRAERLDHLCTEIDAAGGQCTGVVCDVTDACQLVAAVDAAEAAYDLVSILVNNAGVSGARRAHKITPEFLDSVLDTNIRAPWLLACEVAKRLIAARRPGRIVNISSMGAYYFPHGSSASLYSTTKAAVDRMTEVQAVEWAGHRINVNSIAPGSFTTEMTEGITSRVPDFIEKFPRKRMGDPKQLDSTLLYLVSPESECVTGTIIKVDDGQLPR
jgi:NAD(P)-dependent dehydrogenase (short-subunit alcohol dehydrogenase family)